MKSILVDDAEHCIFCGRADVSQHHVFFGPDRPVSDKYGFIVPLCTEHHTGGGNSPHKNRIVDLALKCWAQSIFESKIGSRTEFRTEFRKSYL